MRKAEREKRGAEMGNEYRSVRSDHHTAVEKVSVKPREQAATDTPHC